MTSKPKTARSQAVNLALEEVNGPIDIDDFCQRVLTIYPSTAKKPLAAMRSYIRQDHAGLTLIFLDNKTLVPLPIAMRGVCFRIPISRRAAEQGRLLVSPAFDFLTSRELGSEDLTLLDFQGRPMPTRITTVRERVTTPSGSHVSEHAAFDLREWFGRRKVKRGDSILVTIEDWTAGQYRLNHERSRDRRRAEVQQRDQELADLFFDMLESATSEQIFAVKASPTAYARLSDPAGYPGSHWIDVLVDDPRMTYNGWSIRYSEWRSPLGSGLLGETGIQPHPSLSAAQKRQVYRFKAALKYRPGLWRTIEIQGEQTLADLDMILRDAFEHDTWDHLGGFWKRIRRGTGKRFREVDLGHVDPMGAGSASETIIGELGLAAGQQLKYVYDFGDWIEHTLTLREIVEPEQDATYPRITGRNRPQYQDCITCKTEGRTARATWVCYSCSGEQQREVLICEDCLGRDHEDHYADEILY